MIAWQCTPSTGMWMVGALHRAVRQFVIQRAGKDPRRGGLADPAHAGQDPGLRNPPGLERVRHGADHGVLADQILETGGPVFARQHAIGLAGFRRRGALRIVRGHQRSASIGHRSIRNPDCLSKPACGTQLTRIPIAKPVSTFAEYAPNKSSAGRGYPILRDSLEKTGRRLTSDPIRTSLGLLPSGPDPVGEWLVHRQSPGPYLGPKGPESKRDGAGSSGTCAETRKGISCRHARP